MNDPLTIYLQDHLAGSVHATEILQTMRDDHAKDSLGQFAARLLAEIEADRDVLVGLIERIGAAPSQPKELAAWLAEKVSRLKLKHDSKQGLGTFEALEFLMLGIHGKWAMWRMLAIIAGHDSRLQGTDFGQLTIRAADQHDRVNERRMDYGRSALKPITTANHQRKTG